MHLEGYLLLAELLLCDVLYLANMCMCGLLVLREEKYVKPNDLQSVCGNMCAMISSAGVPIT